MLDMHFTTMDFDLIVATPMEDSVMASKSLKTCPIIIGYQEMSVDLVLLDL